MIQILNTQKFFKNVALQPDDWRGKLGCKDIKTWKLVNEASNQFFCKQSQKKMLDDNCYKDSNRTFFYLKNRYFRYIYLQLKWQWNTSVKITFPFYTLWSCEDGVFFTLK